MVFVFSTISIFSRIPVPTNVCSSGVLENNSDALYELATNRKLVWIFAFSLIVFVASQFISLWIIKNQNAMQKVMLSLMKNFVVWFFFMLFRGNGHEDLSVYKTIGMILLAFGTTYYVNLDM
jgi:hypothetical protein